MTAIQSFPPITTKDAKVLILGTMPSVASLHANRYYAHPRNAFWPIMATLLEFDVALPYPQRVAALKAGRIAVWDVLASCERSGSLDSAIAHASEVPNDFPALFRQCRHLRAVVCNGGTALTLFRRHVLSVVDMTGIALLQLPSTSPAHAGKSLAAKLKAWSSLREYLDD